MATQSSYLDKKGLTVKDLVTIGIINGIVWFALGMHWGDGFGLYHYGYCCRDRCRNKRV